MRRGHILISAIFIMAGLAGCGKSAVDESKIKEEVNMAASNVSEEKSMKITVKSEEYQIVYELNESTAAKDLYAQLPLTLEVEDFSTNEKVCYPPQRLDSKDAPAANAEKGTLAYYSPWGDVVMFYEHYGQGNSLYELGNAVSGKEDIEKLIGTITITVYKE